MPDLQFSSAELLPGVRHSLSKRVGISLHSSWALEGEHPGAREVSRKPRQSHMTFSELALEDTQYHSSIRYWWKQSDAFLDQGEDQKTLPPQTGVSKYLGLCLKKSCSEHVLPFASCQVFLCMLPVWSSLSSRMKDRGAEK